MISVESHSKQIKLLNEYILALEKQVSSAKKETEQIQKTSRQGGDEIKKANDEVARIRGDNQQLRNTIARLSDELKRFNGLEQEYFGLREYLDRELAEKNALILNLQEVTANNKTIYDRMQELEQEAASMKSQFQSDRKKMTEEADATKLVMQQKDKKCEELTFLLSQEKKNSGLRVASLESNTNNLLRIKNEEINRLNKQVDEARLQLSNSLNQSNSNKGNLNETIKQLTSRLTESKVESERLQKQNNQVKSILDKKLYELSVLGNTFNTKVKEYDAYVKRTNEEKSNLLRIVRSLQEEKKSLQTANASFKGDANQTNRALSTNIKKVQQLTQKLENTQNELNTLRSVKTQADTLVTNLKKELQSSYNLCDKVSKEKEEALERQNQVLNQKFNGQAFFNNEINKKQHQIQRLNEYLAELNASIKNKNKVIASLEDEMKEVKAEYSSFRNQSLNLSDSHSSEIEVIKTKMRESERKNNINVQKIESMSQEIKDLQIKFQSERSNLQLTRDELQKVKQAYSKEISELTQYYDLQLKKKNEELVQASLQRQQIGKQLKKSEDSLALLKDESAKNQKSLRQSIKKLQIQRDTHIDKLKTVNLSSLIENQTRSMKQGEIESLRKSISVFDISLKEQKTTIELLTRGLADKEKEIEGLQESNTALRKQIISSISNEQASKKELLEVKSKAGSIMSNSRVRSNYFDSLRTSGIENSVKIPKSVRISTMSNIIRSGSGEKRTFNKKRTTPSQPRSSMIEEPQGFDIQEDIQLVINNESGNLIN